MQRIAYSTQREIVYLPVVKTSRAPLPLVLIALACIGFLHAMAMTHLATHPVFPFERTVTVKGRVMAVEDRGNGAARLRVRPEVIEPAPRD